MTMEGKLLLIKEKWLFFRQKMLLDADVEATHSHPARKANIGLVV
jgi:hypothetical protein